MSEQQVTNFVTSTTVTGILKKMQSVMRMVDRIGKDARNAFDKYDYASEKAIKEALHTAFVEHGVVALFNVLQKNESKVIVKTETRELQNVLMEYRFFDVETGEFIGGTFLGSGTNKDDKGLYAAITGGIKYILTSSFLIPTGDDPEKDDNKKSPKSTNQKETYTPTKEPLDKAPKKDNGPAGKQITEDQRKLMFAEINEVYKSLHAVDAVQFPKNAARLEEFRKVCMMNAISVDSSSKIDMDGLSKLLKILTKFKEVIKEDPAALVTLLFNKDSKAHLEILPPSDTAAVKEMPKEAPKKETSKEELVEEEVPWDSI